MERQDLAGYYGFGTFPGELKCDILSMKHDAVDIGAAAAHVRKRLEGKNFYIFVTCDVTEFEDRQMPFPEFTEKKFGIKGEFLFEPTLGVAHYMSRRGLFLVKDGDIPAALSAMIEYPYHFYAIISDTEPDHAGIDALISETRGMALLPHIAKKCLEHVISTGAEFVHAVKKADEVALNCFYK